MYQELLKSLNLNDSEVEIYLILLKKGELSAKQILSFTELTRTNIYNILASLGEKGLVEEIKDQKKTFFRPTHPNKLQDLLEEKEKALKQAKMSLESSMPSIVSEYNLAVGKPGGSVL